MDSPSDDALSSLSSVKFNSVAATNVGCELRSVFCLLTLELNFSRSLAGLF
jgi:hypothetical protein